MRGHHVTILEFHAERRVRQGLYDLAFHLQQFHDEVAPAAPLWGQSDAAIIAACRAALADLWPASRAAQVLKATLVRIPNSIYRESPGSDRYRPPQATPVPHLYLAGDYTQQDYMASMEGAVRSAHLAARALLNLGAELL